MSNDKKTALKNCAREVFSRQGFKKTNVSDITTCAETAVGTFYQYFQSKVSLFMEIFLEENTRLKKHILSKVDTSGHPMRVLQEIMGLNLQGMRSNPILSEWYNRDIFKKIEEKYREENGIQKLDFLYSDFLSLIKQWQKDGQIRDDIEPEMIMAIFTAIINMDLHKEEIGLQFFPKIQEHLARFTMNGLTKDTHQK